MKIKLKQEKADFIKSSFGIIDTEGEKTYFMPMVYTQSKEDEGTCLFQMKSISELTKYDMLFILKSMLQSQK